MYCHMEDNETDILCIDGYITEIDNELTQLIIALNKVGIRTVECCSGHGKHKPYVRILLDNISLDIGTAFKTHDNWQKCKDMVITWDPEEIEVTQKEL